MKPLMSTLGTMYRGPANSNEYNILFNTIYSDFSVLYDLTDTNIESIRTNMDILVTENFTLQNKVIELEQRLADINMSLSSTDGYKYISKSFTSLTDILYSIEGLDIIEASKGYIDRVNNVAMNPIGSTYSRTSGTDLNGDDFVNEANTIVVEEGTTELNKLIVTSDMSNYNMVDKSPTVYWVKEAASSGDDIFFTINLFLYTPPTGNNYINNITISPFPNGTMTITKIEYTDLNGGEYLLDSFPKDINGDPVAIENFTRTRFCFDKVEASTIKIYGKQSNYIKDNNEKIFTYGFQNIDISYNEYSTQTSSFITEFNISKYDKAYDVVAYPTITLGDGSIQDTNDLIENQLYISHTGDTIVEEYEFNSAIMQADCSKVFILTTINNINNTSPLIKTIILGFTTK